MERLALGLAAILTAVALYLVPSWHDEFLEPFHAAFLGAGGTILLLYFTRRFRLLDLERKVLALFLAIMPVVYMSRVSGEWLWIEGTGLLIFGVCALLGLWRSTWFLAAGIVGHGLGWDLWHYLQSSPSTPSWYALGCMIIDVGIGAYVAVRAARE